MQTNKEKLALEKWQQMSLYEKALNAKGYLYIAGVDEAGRGPLAGPVTAAAVILSPDTYLPGLNDSKQLSEKKREQLAIQIKETAIAWACVSVDHATIDRINILQATKLAMKQALAELSPQPDYVLLDALTLDIALPQEGIIKGDALSVSIAAASIIAKTTRDHLMQEYDHLYPEYQFGKHKGYPTPLHKELLRQYGFSPIHRRTFRF